LPAPDPSREPTTWLLELTQRYGPALIKNFSDCDSMSRITNPLLSLNPSNENLMNKRISGLWVLFLILLAQCAPKINPSGYWTGISKKAVSAKAMVVSAHPLASKVGIRILHQGGNAVDAAVGVQFALAVVYPRAGNIGGGGFMVYRAASGETNTLDYREKAPALASRDMYLDSLGNPGTGSVLGHLASGVPGTVDGLITAHAKYGKLSFEKIIAPAIRLAEDGFQVTADEAARLQDYREVFVRTNGMENAFVKANKWKEGDWLIQKELAWTLKQIRDRGRAGFYEGPVADRIVAEMIQGKGIISHDDLKAYRSVWRKPVIVPYRDYKVISMAPPSSGGIALGQLLKMVEPYPLKDWGFRDSRTIHLMVEAERRVYADRAQYLGDADFYPVPQDSLLNPKYLKYRMQDYREEQASKSSSVYAGNFKLALEHFETTHLSVVDQYGNAVAVTTTLNGNFGSKVIVDGAGFLMNNEMDDFSVKPGVPNMFGLIGGEANAIQPGKRMLSSMTPTIVEKNGKLSMVVGTPGGSTIITSVFQVILNVLEWNMPMGEAVAASRFHHQWLPDEIILEENAFDPVLKSKLESMGHKIRSISSIGLVDAIRVRPDGGLEGGADPRGDDHAEGW